MRITTGTSELRAIVEGREDGEAVLLLHGGPGIPDYLADVATILNDRFRTIRFDQRGVGGSVACAGDYRIESYLEDINQVVQALNIDRFHLFGHSWGGLLAQIYTSSFPQRVLSLFLSSPSSGTGEVWKGMEKEVMRHNRRQATSLEWLGMGVNSLFGMMGMDFAYRNIFGNVWRYYFRNPREVPAPGEDWLNGIRAAAVNGTRQSILKMNCEELDERFTRVRVPTVIVYGAYDIYGPSRARTGERIPEAEQVFLADSGHLPWIQDRAAFLAVLRRFYGLD